MVTIGDVMGIVAFLLGLGGTAWAMTVAMGLLFPGHAARAAEAVNGGAFWRGLLPLGAGILGTVFLSLPNPLMKLVGWAVFLGVLALGAVGLTGLAKVAGGRIAALAPEMGEYPAFLRGAGFLVAASLFPLLGWFLFAPVAFVVALGAGGAALGRRRAVVAEA